MFLSLQGTSGGRKMCWFDRSRQPETITFHNRETGEPVIVEDYATITIGYLRGEVRKGDKMYMKISEFEEVLKRVAPEFGYTKKKAKKKWF